MDEMFQLKLLLQRLAACAHPAQQQLTVETLQLHIWNVPRLALSCAAVPPATTGSLAATVVRKQKLSMSIKNVYHYEDCVINGLCPNRKHGTWPKENKFFVYI